jgi:hypothetical protein
MLIPKAHERFDEHGNLQDEQTRERMRRFLAALVEWAEHFEGSTKAYQKKTQ